MKKIAVIFGTRPEAIKLCPVVLTLKNNPAFECRVCVTGQHREMLQQVLDVFGVVPDIALAHELLNGWEPKVPLQDGLTKTIAYFKGRFA